jgi:hypothetical protein
MKVPLYILITSIVCLTATYIPCFAQNPDTDKDSTKTKNQRLFKSDEVLQVKLLTDFRALQKDRNDDADYHEALMIYVDESGDSVHVPLKIKARGNFRRNSANCSLPPLMLNFPEKKVKGTLFKNQDKLKLVTRCRDAGYIVQEYMVYKMYNLITHYSFKARMAMITYEDSSGKRKTETSPGFIIEDEDALAKRHNMTLRGKEVETKNYLTDQLGMCTMVVFQYMIGNTDWSVPFQHNIKLLNQSTGLPMPVAYDFDHAGIVEASYASPAPELSLRSTRERLYRGLGYSEAIFAQVFEKFNQAKPDIYALYEGNSQLNPAYIKRTLKYLDDFYELINNPNQARSVFMGNTKKKSDDVVIKGLNN